jgi:hypothetical protein
MYATSCRSDSDCCEGLTCNLFTGWSQCLENTAYSTISSGCKTTQTVWGCNVNSDCCNPFASCDSNRMCNLLQPCVTVLTNPGGSGGTTKPPVSTPSMQPIFPKTPTVIPSGPSLSPIVQTSLGYYSTRGNQIIDQNGNTVRIAGINWY